MKRLHSRFRIFLLTFAFGLACVPFFNDVSKRWTVFSIKTPEVQSETPLLVFPKYRSEMPPSASGCGGRMTAEELEAEQKKKARRKNELFRKGHSRR